MQSSTLRKHARRCHHCKIWFLSCRHYLLIYIVFKPNVFGVGVGWSISEFKELDFDLTDCNPTF